MVKAKSLPVDTGASATEMADAIFGDGVNVVAASYSGDDGSSGIYSNGDKISGDVTPGDTGVILSTGRASQFANNRGQANQDNNQSTNTGGVNNDAAFNDLVGANTYDASFLTVDFIPTGDTLTMEFVFSSEEYPEYTGSIYNDAVGVWVNGAPASMEVGNGHTSVGNVNHVNNINLYNDNTSDAFNTEMDGFTVTMTLTMQVIPGQVNTLRIGIADVMDSNYDSNILIAGNSVQTVLVAHEDAVRIDPGQEAVLDVLGNDFSASNGVITVTHINGVAVSAGDTVTLPNGQAVTLNADGTFTIAVDSDEEVANFTYSIEDDTGHTDTGFVTVSTVPCFVSGTMIRTPGGEVPVERLRVGDLVDTQDHGPQPLRWIGRRKTAATDRFAPIHIDANTFGTHRPLRVSPQHRVLVRNAASELLFGETEVLVAARHLVNGRSVRRIEGGMVEYVHLLFDAHEVVFSEGLPTESFLPGPQTTAVFEADILDEICTLFPELDPRTGDGYGPAARRTLKEFEGRVLARAVLAQGRLAA
ncbi:MAG: 2,3,4,5-tetrahydropyridine-2,6-carboxylate N-succinyltransferase [Maritimibacter sp.]|nr:2,3,4,5-tetrahydropyridine-2,6-carboxylate N-succinyltransferase [Maritimibacter sp.]